MAARHGRWLVIPAAVALATAGCGEPDTVRVHDESAPARAAAPSVPESQKKFRTLAAMVPVDMDATEANRTGPQWWFFKTSGPAVTIAKFQPDFDSIIGSIQARADEGEPIVWNLPAGWTRVDAPKGGFQYATLKAPGGAIEVSVTRLSGTVLANAQRWWGQLWGTDKQQDLTPALLPEFMKQRQVHGRLVLQFDMAGPNEPKRGPMMMNPHAGGM